MDNQKPLSIGRGRGGRGTLLMAALQNEPRRPGESSGVPAAVLLPPPICQEAEQIPNRPVQRVCIGRGAVLQQLLQARSSSTAPIEEKTQVIGRGRPTVSHGRGVNMTTPIEQPSSSSSGGQTSPSSIESSQSPAISEMSALSIKDYHGTSGAVVPMEVNYVRLKTIQSHGICEYHVQFVPLVDSRNMRFKLMAQPQVKEVIGNVKSFDGAKLYLPKLLQGETQLQAAMPTDNSPVTIHIKYIKEAKACDLIHLYNLILRKIMSVLKMTLVGRNYFDPKGGIPVPQHHLEIWPGYVTAIQEFEGGIMLNCDASFRVLRTRTARDVIVQCADNAERMNTNIAKNLIGTIVLTRYNNKTYRVDDLATNMTPMSKFSTRDGKEITFFDYYKNCYDITIKDLNQPLLINRPKKKVNEEGDRLICLIPELCFMTGLTDSMRSDFKVMKDISAHTRVTPERRQYALKKFINNIKSTPEAMKVLNDWNLEFDSATLSLDGRSLGFENIYFKKGQCSAGPKAEWSREMNARNGVLVPVHLENWIVVCTKRDSSKVVAFLKMMKIVAPSLGVHINEPMVREIPNDRTETYCSEIMKYVDPRVQMVIVIFPTSRDDRYNAIKKLCCVDMPVPSQVVNVRTISQEKMLRSVTQKIALQINCKMGGELWSLNIPLKDIMVCGMDSYHDSTNKRNSILGFVASLNCNLTRWFSITGTQSQGQEIGDCLKILFISALRKYHQVNHRLPKKILLFRDGVGDGMLQTVKNYEVPQLISCFSNMQLDYEPSLSVIVVQKRINTRLYEKSGQSLNNPLPGSVMDHTITRKGLYDFFLVSQHVGQGTVTPTHYIVSYDSSNLKPDHMQKLSYKLTHLYYNWPGTIRVPAPCQYAHKLAYLVGQNLHKEASPELADKLFYL